MAFGPRIERSVEGQMLDVEFGRLAFGFLQLTNEYSLAVGHRRDVDFDDLCLISSFGSDLKGLENLRWLRKVSSDGLKFCIA